MKVLVVLSAFRPPSHSFPIGGGEISNRELLEMLAASGHEVVVHAMNAGEHGWVDQKGMSIIDGGLGKSGASRKIACWVSGTLKLRKELRSRSCPDVILTSVGTAGMAARIAARLNVPLGVMVRALRDIEPYQGPVWKRIAKEVVHGRGDWRDATDLIANSRFIKNRCFRSGYKGTGWVVYPSIDVGESTSSWPSVINSVAMVGSSPEKGIDTFIELARRIPGIQFRVIGDRGVPAGSVESEGNVTRVGWTNDPVEQIDQCDVFLMPSKVEEAFGRAAVEAILRNKLVLCSRIGGLPEAVIDDLLLVDPLDIDGWHERLFRLIRAPKDFHQAMANARVSALAFSLEEQGRNLENVLHQMICSYKGRSANEH